MVLCYNGRMVVTVISTVLNEGESVRRLMDSLLAQTRQADEVVIVDGGSRDNTVAVLNEYGGRLPLRVLVEPGANISRGRNVAVQMAGGDLFACADAGVWLEPGWLECLLAPFENAPSDRWGNVRPQAVAGFFVPDVASPFEIAMGATVLPTLAEVNPATFLPSSRSVAFTRAAWQAAGGYPEWIDYCEDLIFDLRMRAACGPFGWAPGALAHFRPRSSLRAFFKQYYRYARGDGKADLWRRRHAIRYATYLVALPVLLVLSVLRSPLWLLALGGGFLAYCRTPYRRLLPYLPRVSTGDRLRTILLIPLIRVAGDVAKMLGYPVGWAWRIRNWRRAEVHWQHTKDQAPGGAWSVRR
jgi:glycosyltransferase involved in cell wall biosynthesis